MKTNKERSKILITQYKENKESNTKDRDNYTSNNNGGGAKSLTLNKKIWIASSLAFVMIVGAVLGLVFGLMKNEKPNNGVFNLDNMYIVNFSDYKAIGAGVQNVVQDQTNSLYLAGNSQKQKPKLVGVKNDGEVEEIKVSETPDGQPQEITWNLVNLYSFKKFTIACFTFDEYVSFNSESALRIDYFCRVVIIDNITGKMYSLNDLSYVQNNNWKTVDIKILKDKYYTDSMESEDSLFFYTERYDEDKIIYNFYKATIVDGDLVLQKLFEKSPNANMVEHQVNSTFVDRYGNIYLSKAATTHDYINKVSPTYVNYMITSNGELKRLNQISLFRSINGRVYTGDKTQYVDENGNFVTNSFMGCDTFISKDLLIKKVGYLEYYYGSGYSSRLDFKDAIYKVTWQDDVEFSVEKIAIDKTAENFVSTEDKLYFMSDESIYSTVIVSGEQQEIVSEYFFTLIDTDNLGNVTFVALNSQMESVSGIISNEGDVQVSIAPREYIVYYIKALN